jgi:hypothetical protein
VIENYRNKPDQERTVKLPNHSKLEGDAIFFILQSAAPNSTAIVEDVSFFKGSEKLKAFADELQAARYGQIFPDEAPVKILRRGDLSCKADADCTFVLSLPDDVKSVD